MLSPNQVRRVESPNLRTWQDRKRTLLQFHPRIAAARGARSRTRVSDQAPDRGRLLVLQQVVRKRTVAMPSALIRGRSGSRRLLLLGSTIAKATRTSVKPHHGKELKSFPIDLSSVP